MDETHNLHSRTASARHVFLYHMRKTGGTSLRVYCERLARTKGLTYDVVEGFSLDHESVFESGPPAIHITSLRQPIERIKSSYRFEGRWPQQEEHPSRANAKPFARWIAETLTDHPHQRDFLWTCSSNYYVKALIGYPRLGGASIGPRETEIAKRRLERFEVVLATEQFDAPETSRYLRRVLDFDEPIPRLRIGQERAPEPESDAELFDEATLALLVNANRWDLELYDFARKLSRERLVLLTGDERA